jgi:hypothetical protein
VSDAKAKLATRIALTHRNIADLTQRAAMAHGPVAEENIAALLHKQQELLNDLLRQKETLEAEEQPS